MYELLIHAKVIYILVEEMLMRVTATIRVQHLLF